MKTANGEIKTSKEYAYISVCKTDEMNGNCIIDDAVFSWLKTEYGEDALEWRICEDYRTEACRGVQYARDVMKSHGHEIANTIIVTLIKCHPAHSSPATVHDAAAKATWSLFDFNETSPLSR